MLPIKEPTSTFQCLQDFTGGNVVFTMASLSYISDVTTRETRTRRISYMTGTMIIGYMLGMGLGSSLKSMYVAIEHDNKENQLINH